MNNISKTIKESLDEDKKKVMVFCRDFIYSLRDAGYEIPEQKRVELEQFFKSHLLQSQIRLIDALIRNSQEGRVNFEYSPGSFNDGYNNALEDQISSLNETLEFLKKSL